MKKIFLPILLLTVNFSFAQVDLNLGLKAYYPFSGNANDISGNNNNPVFNNATLTADRFGNPNSAYRFNGSSNYMQIPNSASLNTNNKLTLSAWVKPMGFYSGSCHGNALVTKGNSGNTPGLYAIWYDDNAGTNGANCSGPLNPAVENFYGIGCMTPAPGYTPYIQTNQWYSVIVTYDGTTARLYINCELINTVSQGGLTFNNADDLFIGKTFAAAFPYWVNGDIDEVRIYDRALTVDEVNVLGGCITTTSCNTWLKTQASGSSVRIGDLDISGTQVTVEATFNRIAPWSGSYLYSGDIVSKHSGPADVNYLLRPNSAEITTNNGYFLTPPVCLVDLNKTYHVALVYDGSTLKFYRNGFLMSQVPATGNLFLNNYITTIGDYASGPNVGSYFQGYINEVRIWNVARTQAQLQTYMNSSIPNPATQTGLLAYYTFDNLLNKQGNATWNGTLNGGATINNTNPNCTFIADSCSVSLSCNTWLQTPSVNSNARAGDLDISGNQLTVEASFNRTAPVNPVGGYGFLVSKHTTVGNINYALWPNGCAISTVNGDALIQENCPIQLNKTYHVAMVYDGASLKFYRNGFLHSQAPASGNLVLNNLITTLAQNVPEGAPTIFPFIGYMNEVRIWNVARTQAQLQTYMDASLPNPTTQTGLRAYYTFDDLQNKQGNATYNATLNGAASINATNPNCTFVADSCGIIPITVGCKGVIDLHGNDCVRLPLSQEYYANTGFTWETWFNSHWYENNDNTLRLGQSLMMSEDAVLCEDIQLGFGWVNIPRNTIGFVVDAPGQCAARDNNPVFYKPPGGFQPNTWYHVAAVRNYSTNQTLLYFNGQLVDTKTNSGAAFSRNILTRIGTYTFVQDSGFVGKMDEIRIWKTPRTAAEILANYNKCLTGNETGLAAYYRSNQSSGLILNNAVNNPSLNGTLDPTVNWNNTINAPLINSCGMQINTTINITICQGMTYGGHSTSGTYIDSFHLANGCDSIRALNLTVLANIDSVRIKDSLLNCNGFDFKGRAYFNTTGIASWNWFFGDGGTANTQNTSHAYAVAGTYMVKLVVTDSIGCKDSASINVNALPGINAEAGSDTSICSNGTVSVQLNGTAIGGPYLWSPAIYLNNPNIQNPVATISSTTTFYLNVTGAGCTSIDSVTITIDPLPLIDAIKDTAICRFSTLVLSTVSNAVSYLWSPAAFVSNPTIANPNYIDNFSHKVYVTGTSAAGCNATDSVDVTVNPLPVVQTIPDTVICIAQNITLATTGAQTYSWSPAAGLNNPGIANPVFSGASGQTYTVTGTDGNGCKNTDQVTISISAPDSLKQPPSFSICQLQSVQLNGNNGTHVSYLWSPVTYLSNATIINPVANPPQTTVYSLLVTDNQCGFDSLFTTLLTVIPAPVINAGKSNDLDCAFNSARLFAAGGNQYLWSPSAGLSDPNISNPVATPANTQTYTVLVTDATGCTNTGSVTVFKNNTASLARYMPNAFTPNGDGKNDCYGLKNWMYVKQLQFYIFNRYGERVFATANPNVCWDGMYKGKPALAGTYVFVIKAQTDCGLEEQKGNVLLIR